MANYFKPKHVALCFLNVMLCCDILLCLITQRGFAVLRKVMQETTI